MLSSEIEGKNPLFLRNYRCFHEALRHVNSHFTEIFFLNGMDCLSLLFLFHSRFISYLFASSSLIMPQTADVLNFVHLLYVKLDHSNIPAMHYQMLLIYLIRIYAKCVDGSCAAPSHLLSHGAIDYAQLSIVT